MNCVASPPNHKQYSYIGMHKHETPTRWQITVIDKTLTICLCCTASICTHTHTQTHARVFDAFSSTVHGTSFDYTSKLLSLCRVRLVLSCDACRFQISSYARSRHCYRMCHEIMCFVVRVEKFDTQILYK